MDCSPPQLTSQRLHIRALAQQDLPAFVRYRRHPDVARYQSWSDYDDARGQALLDSQKGQRFGEEDTWFQMAVCDNHGNLLGDLALHFLYDNQLEIGFTLAPEHQGKGLAGEAVSTLLTWFFSHCQGHRVTAICDVENHASYRLLERLGFRREAHWIDNVFFKGAWGSEYQYALLAREWQALQGN